ncbi:NfeD family protein [Rhodocaloribacter sp.]
MRLLPIVLLLLGTVSLARPGATPPDAGRADAPVVWLRLPGEAITPVTARYIARGLREARDVRAAALILELDTPGGLMESTRDLVMAILDSPVPVVVYVAPSGARAASAGVFITMASHVAAMAPATHIGAAHPVSIGGAPFGPPASPDSSQTPGVMEQKIVNDAVAWVRSLAELRGRNAEWAARAVTESVSITAREALAEGVIDLIAAGPEELLAALDGRAVETTAGPMRLETVDAELIPVEMWWGERLLGILSNPNVAFLLLMFGFYGILFEFYSPGWGIAGTLGVICLVLSFFGLAVLPINYAGLALIGLALGMFVAEAFFTSYGALTLGGVVCLVLGGVMLVDTPVPVMRVSLSVLLPVAAATALVTFFLMTRIFKAQRSRVRTGVEALLNEEAVAVEAFRPEGAHYRGMVRIHGELWRAEASVPVAAGARLRPTGRKGLTLTVAPIEDRP